MGELIAIPEKECWLYEGKQQYICTCFGVAMLYHEDALGDIEINPQEFTSDDIFQLTIYDKNYKLPEECRINDPQLSYCTISGLYKVDPLTYKKDLQSHMNEKCSS